MRRFVCSGCLTLLGCLMTTGRVGAAASPLYQWNFDQSAGAGTSVAPAVTPNGLASDGGILTLATANGSAGPTYTPTNLFTAGGGGVSGAAGDYGFNNGASVSNNPNPGGIAYTTAANTLTAMPNLTQFTLTMWVKPTTAELSQQSRLLEIATTNNFDEAANGIWVALNAGHVAYGGSSNNASLVTTGTGSLLVANAWNFVAVEVNLTSTNPFFDMPMRTASGNAVSDSSAVYQGDNISGVYGYSYQASYGAASTMNFASTTDYVQLLNRTSNANRAFQGQGDDFRVYNSLLSTSDLQLLASVAPVPEPGSMGLLGVTAIGLLHRRRKV